MKKSMVLQGCVIVLSSLFLIACVNDTQEKKPNLSANNDQKENVVSHENNSNEKVDAVNEPDPLFKSIPIQYDSAKRYIFLTWDDAPQPGTEICKNIFHQNGVKATFFAIGLHQLDPGGKHIVNSIRESYPEFLLANHSYSHAFRNRYAKFYKLADSAVQDFMRAEREMQIEVKIIRLPGNCSWASEGRLQGPKSTMPVCKKLDSLGYCVIGWDVEWRAREGGVPAQSVDQMLKEVNDAFESGSTYEPNAIVILAHDRMFAKKPYSDYLNEFITALKQDSRNVFETLDHYPMVQRRTAN